MLEGIVEDEHLGFQLLNSDPRQCETIAVLEVGDIGQILLQHSALVVEAGGLAVASTQDRDPTPSATIPTRDPLHHRRLAGPANSEVSYRDNRDFRPMDGQPAPVISEVTYAHNRPVADRRDR